GAGPSGEHHRGRAAAEAVGTLASGGGHPGIVDGPHRPHAPCRRNVSESMSAGVLHALDAALHPQGRAPRGPSSTPGARKIGRASCRERVESLEDRDILEKQGTGIRGNERRHHTARTWTKQL